MLFSDAFGFPCYVCRWIIHDEVDDDILDSQLVCFPFLGGGSLRGIAQINHD